MPPKIRSQVGFGLIEIIIVSGIMTIIGLGAASLMSNLQHTQNNVKFRTDADTFASEVRGLLSSTETCMINFNGLLARPGSPDLNIASLKNSIGGIAYTTGRVPPGANVYGDRTLRLDLMTLSKFKVGASATRFTASLALSVGTVKTSMGAQSVLREIAISTTLDPSGKILSCVALANMSDGIWQRNAMNPGNIYYVSPLPFGYVGIGTPTPTNQLETATDTTVGRGIISTFYSDTNYFGGVISARFGRGTMANPKAVRTTDPIGWFNMQGFDGSGFAPTASSSGMGSSATENWTSTKHGSNLHFYTVANGSSNGTQRVMITAQGNVGIGTPNPGALLEVQGTAVINGSANTQLSVTNNGIGNQAISAVHSGNGTGIFASTDGGTAVYGSGGSGTGVYGTTSGSGIAVHGVTTTGGTAVMAAASARAGARAIALNANLSGGGNSGYAIQATNNSAGGFAIYADGTSPSFFNGNVGIGTPGPLYKLDVNGDINASGNVRSSGLALTSDIRYKRNIQNLDDVLEKLLSINGVSFNWRSDEYPRKHFNNRHQVGLIAQEVEKQFPEVVDTDAEGYKSVNYSALVAPVIEAIKNMNGRIVADNAEIEALRKENLDLKARLEKLERLLNGPGR